MGEKMVTFLGEFWIKIKARHSCSETGCVKRARPTFGLAIWALIALSAPHFVFTFQSDKVDVSGTWDLTVESPEGKATPTMALTQEGEKLTGTYTGRLGKANLEGTLKGSDIKFIVTHKFLSQPITVTYTGTVDGDSMKGTAQFSPGGSGSFTARRRKKSSLGYAHDSRNHLRAIPAFFESSSL
jgi:hypothetical protein